MRRARPKARCLRPGPGRVRVLRAASYHPRAHAACASRIRRGAADQELVRQRNATGSVDAAELEGELDVARGGEPGQESGLLKDQRDAPIDCDLTRRRPVKTGE